MSDYIPNRDSDFLAWLNSFMSFAGGNMVPLGLVAADMTALGLEVSNLSTALSNNNNAQRAAQGTRNAKDQARLAAEKIFRRYAKDLQNRPTVTDQQRASLGIRVRDTQANTASLMVSTAPTRPLVLVDNARKLEHRVRFVEEGQPTRRARPEGVKGIEIWMSVLASGAAAPADESAMQYVGTPSAGPIQRTFAAADAGKTAWYRSRWVANDGARGDWSNMTCAMVLG